MWADMATLDARVEVSLGRRVQPWLSGSIFVLGIGCDPEASCPTGGGAVQAGVTAFLLGPDDRFPLRPYAGGGMGVRRYAGGFSFARVLDAGILWAASPAVAPRLEVRWERYPALREAFLVALGVRFGIGDR
ncbi:MAG TPA: hypothetical protein VFQ38_13770 [Longimicrobiales bacterium]|nr:hypothetical protein [Longimicrobiales bacterium]